MKFKNLLTYLAAPLLAASLGVGCNHTVKKDVHGIEERVENLEKGVNPEVLETLKEQTGQGATVMLNLCAVLKSQEELKKNFPKYETEYSDLEKDDYFSLNNNTVVVKKPKGTEFEKDLFIQRVKFCKKVKKSITPSFPDYPVGEMGSPFEFYAPGLQSMSMPEAPKITALSTKEDGLRRGGDDETAAVPKAESPEEKAKEVAVPPAPAPMPPKPKVEKEVEECEEVVHVRHYSSLDELTGPYDLWDSEKEYYYKINPKNGNVSTSSKSIYPNIWNPVNAFGVYKVSEDGTLGSENLLLNQDIKVLEDGTLVLKTMDLGDNENGKYRVKVIAKAKVEKKKPKVPKSLLEATSLSQLKIFPWYGMARGSLEHIYSGVDPMAPSTVKEKRDVTLIMSNHHVYEEVVSGGEWLLPGPDGQIRGVCFNIGAQGLARFDERPDGEWLLAFPYNYMYKEDLDAMVLELEHPLKPGTLPEVKFARCDPSFGERTIVVGHPKGLLDEQVNIRAVISHPQHDVTSGWLDMIAFYGDLIGGNSGGGLYNMDGEFLGITSGTYIRVMSVSEAEAESLEDISGAEELFVEDKDITFKDVKGELFALASKHYHVLALEAKLKNNPAMIANELTTIYHEEQAFPTGRVLYVNPISSDKKELVLYPSVHPTGLNLARKGTRVQEWFWTHGLNLGQPHGCGAACGDYEDVCK